MCQVAPGMSATQLAIQLLERNVLVKDLTGKVGMQHGEYVRIAVRNRDDNHALLNALREIGSSVEHSHTSTAYVQKPTVATAAKSERWHGEGWAAARVSP